MNEASPPQPNDLFEETTEEAQKYPYAPLLKQLETKAYQSLRVADPAKDTESSQWDLSHDALLATLLHEFTNHIVQRTHEVSSEVQKLQSSVNKVGVDVASVQNKWMESSRTVTMEQVITEDQDAVSDSKRQEDQPNKLAEENEIGSDDDSAAEIARLEEEEKAAIRDGMKALTLFYDARTARQSSEGTSDKIGLDNDEDMNVFDADEDVIGDNCYYYPSAEGDVFNQRPLPFIVGSREFMESSCAGLDAADDCDVVG
jgi:hypothetical protein